MKTNRKTHYKLGYRLGSGSPGWTKRLAISRDPNNSVSLEDHLMNELQTTRKDAVVA